jgi:DNA polymerase-3 subunit gamma/tau
MVKDNQANEYIVTARKWRPLKFADVIGQEHITMTLQNSIRLKRSHHAYLFSGPRGIGKTTTARILARALNCSNLKDTEPCNECESCVSILESRSMDVIEIDGASNNSVEDVKKIREYIKFTPVTGNYKIYIIDEVHMLSTSAFNALLKTLEEPPPHIIFIFATTEPHKVPATILSRCQRHNFRRIELDKITSQLSFIAQKESIKIDEESLVTIARKADGSMRDAQSIFDQVVAYCGTNVDFTQVTDALHLIDIEFYFRISKAIKEKNVKEMFAIANEVVTKGYDLQECLSGLLEHFRNILVTKISENTNLIERSSATIERYLNEASYFTKADMLRILNLIASSEQALRYSPQPRIRFEMALIQLASLDSALEISTILDFINKHKSDEIPSSMKGQSNFPVYDMPIKSEEKKTINEPAKKQYSAQNTEEENEKNQKSDSKPGKTINAEGIESRWIEFVTKHASHDSGFVLLNQPDIIIPNFFNGEIVFKTSEKFIEEMYSKMKHQLEKLLEDFYGTEITTKFMTETIPTDKISSTKAKRQISETGEEKQSMKSTLQEKKHDIIEENSDDKSYSDKHPVEKAIIDMFNAKEI